MPESISYSEKYFDDVYEYRHVILPRDLVPMLQKDKLMTEMEWRMLGVQQSPGWVHYVIHRPEPHVLLFRRPLNYQQQVAQHQMARQQMAQQQHHQQQHLLHH